MIVTTGNTWESIRYRIIDPILFGQDDDYKAEEYWRARFSRFGTGLRGVGYATKSEETNLLMYKRAVGTLSDFIKKEGINLSDSKILDVGCGQGFYAKFFSDAGIKDYTGLDITDILFGQLIQKYPGYRFIKGDVSARYIEGEFDLILMIDVTQHIVNDEKFVFAMRNVESHLRKGGHIIVTSYLAKEPRKISFSNKARTMDDYKNIFGKGFQFGEPVPFRDKYIFSIKRLG
ncbi:MAG: class I SAM-dependent methyltransferase [Candidatus Pacebacteria bacterium]|nr:class I SAM-dependent methyltransferase [Candidatus Paceibacterota bacterium]